MDDDVRYYDRIDGVAPITLNVSKQTVSRPDTTAKLTRRQTAILTKLLQEQFKDEREKRYLSVAEAEYEANTSVQTLHSYTLPALNRTLARFNMAIKKLVQTDKNGDAVLDKQGHYITVGYVIVSLRQWNERAS